jgi:hypothetical protein
MPPKKKTANAAPSTTKPKRDVTASEAKPKATRGKKTDEVAEAEPGKLFAFVMLLPLIVVS